MILKSNTKPKMEFRFEMMTIEAWAEAKLLIMVKKEDQNREEIEEDESGDDEPQVIDYTPKEMYLLEKKGEFPKKTYIIEECFKSYTAVLHFFESQMIFDQSPFASHVNFICKECKKDMDIIWPKFSNLNRHLRLDCIEKAKRWYLIFAKNHGKILRPTHQSTQLIEFNN
jgi:hypothetical protein